MAIEFRCSQCGRLLRVGDDTAGKRAQCPECGTVTTIPAPSGGPPGASPAGEGEPFSFEPPSTGRAFDPGAAPTTPPGEAENPYQSPTQFSQPVQYVPTGPDPMAASRVSGPATALSVTGILGLIGCVLGILMNMFTLSMAAAGPGRRPAEAAAVNATMAGIGIVQGIIGIVLAIVIIMGASRMKNLESYSFAMAAAIIAMIPCISPCCLLGLPFGIWALTVLSDARVKAAFRS